MYPRLDRLTWFDGLTLLILDKPVKIFSMWLSNFHEADLRFDWSTWFEELYFFNFDENIFFYEKH